MYNISTIEQARTLLAKENLSSEEVRELLLYFLQRDEETRRASYATASTLMIILKALPLLTIQVSRIIPRDEVETLQQLTNFATEMRRLFDSLQPKTPLH